MVSYLIVIALLPSVLLKYEEYIGKYMFLVNMIYNIYSV